MLDRSRVRSSTPHGPRTCLAPLLGATVALAGAALPAYGSSHREAPLVASDRYADFSDVYTSISAADPADDRVFIAYDEDTGTGFSEIFLQGFNIHLSSPSAVFPTPQVLSGTGVTAFEPRLAVGAERIVTGWFQSSSGPGQAPGTWMQVSRLGLPLINEALIGLNDKDQFGYVADVDAAPSGDFYLTRFQSDSLSPATGYVIDRLDANGVTLSSAPFAHEFSFPFEPRTAVDASLPGGPVAAYLGNCTPAFPQTCDIRVVRMNPDGVPIGPPVAANAAPAPFPTYPQIDVDGDGNIAVTWSQFNPVTGLFSVLVNAISAAGAVGTPTALGGGILINADKPGIAVSGDTVTQVYHADSPGTDTDIYMERRVVDGRRLGGILRVNGLTEGFQWNPSMGALRNGGVAVVWTAEDPDTSGASILYGIDLDPPPPHDQNTLISEDFGTRYTPVDLNFLVTHDGGAPTAGDSLDIVVDPDDPLDQSNNGVLHGRSTGGTLSADWRHDSPLPGSFFDVDTPMEFRIGFRAQNGGPMDLDLGLEIEAFPMADPGARVPISSTRTIILSDPNRWGDYSATSRLADPILEMFMNDSDGHWMIDFRLTAKAAGDPEFWLDDLRVDLVAIPLPPAGWLFALGLAGLLRAGRPPGTQTPARPASGAGGIR